MNDSKNSNNRRQAEHSEGMNIGDIYFVLFRRKWIILGCSAAGLAAAVFLIITKPAQYQTEAKLLVRQVMENRGPTQTDPNSTVMTTAGNSASIINTEIEILNSLDLAEEVAREIGPERILGRGDVYDATNAAAIAITNGLSVDAATRDSVIPIMYQHPDAGVAQEVLTDIIGAYLKKHTEMHQPAGLTDELIKREADKLKAQLAGTDTALEEAKQQVNVASLEDAEKTAADYVGQIHQQLLTAEADLAEHRSMAGVSETPARQAQTTNAADAAVVPPEVLREYQNTCTVLMTLNQNEQKLLLTSPETSPFVLTNRADIARVEKDKQRLEQLFPSLAGMAVATPVVLVPTPGGTQDGESEAVRVRALEARTNSLHAQFDKAEAEVAKLAAMEAPIHSLQRERDSEELRLNNFVNTMEQGKINKELGTGEGSGDISIVQSPSPPRRKHAKAFKKLVLGLAGGGVGAGLALAFLLEFVLDRSIKRPVEVERKLHIPLLISIPDVGARSRAAGSPARLAEPLLLKNGETEALAVAEREIQVDLPETERMSSLHRFYEGLRDRLMVNFDIRNLTHHPKLVAVTSCGRGAGVTTIASGLAASLSETGDGNVLLVDMNFGKGAAQQFYKGKASCGLEDALENETMGSALVEGNLYVATERMGNERLPKVLPRRFANLMPKLKASDYDYIIFDMPPVSQTSVTSRLAGLMDMVLLVVEAEKTSQDVAKLANSMLADSKASVSAVLNKTHCYVPQRLHQDSLDDV
jgi:succinoglycan biosynthesis transport protein ExoP